MKTTNATLIAFKTVTVASLLLLVARSADARIGANQPYFYEATTERGLQDETTGPASAVYVMTNRVSGVGNSVLVFDRNVEDGTLSRVGLFDTGMHNIHYWQLSTLGFPADEQVSTPSNGFDSLLVYL